MSGKANIRIATVVGARPQFIKSFSVSRALSKLGGVDEVLVHSGQHYDPLMSDVFFRELGLKQPDFNLCVGSGSHASQTSSIISKLESILLSVKPDIVLVYGDTNTTLAGSLTAAKLSIPVAHVEAGMRCGVPTMPEEINRIVTDHVSSVYFCSTKTAVANLRGEGIRKNIHLVGDVMLDSFEAFQKEAEKRFIVLKGALSINSKYNLLTIHRAENADDSVRLKKIISGCARSENTVIFPAHPRTMQTAKKLLSSKSNIRLIEPVSYIDMLALESGADKIITDSGGVQKEAYFWGKPCITLREETEWLETVASGWNILAGCNPKLITDYINNFNPPAKKSNIFGKSGAADSIAELLLKFRSEAS